MRPIIAIAVCFVACATPSAQDVEASAIHYELGVDANGKGDARAALQEFLTAVEKNPEMPEARNALGALYMLSFRRPADAEIHLKKAIELKPDFSEARNNLGTLYLAQERYPEAIEQLKKALENPLYRTPYAAETNLGLALFKTGKTKEGIDQIRNTLAAQPKFCHGHKVLGLMYKESAQPKEAWESFEKFAKTCPETQEAHQLVAEARVRQGDAAGARQAFERCRALGADNELGARCALGEKELPPEQ